MSSSTDSRIVTMKFDNAQFERGVSQTMGSLDKLNQSLQMKGATQGIHGIQDAVGKVNFGPLEGGITRVSAAFMAMSTVAITALSNITNKAVDAGISLAKSLTIDPMKAGFQEYELKLGSIQTILANTQRYGTTLPEVTSALDELNHYADKTIYNFGDMTKNIGLFTNAGIKIEDATAMIKGFSNSAAASGTSAEGAAGAAYQLSQALSTGTIRLMDWRSLTNVGMGNKNMQEGIINIAEAMGSFEGTTIGAKDAAEDFNGSLEKNWLSADVMSTYLKIMAGEMDAAAMSSLGLSEAQIKTFQQQQKTAEEAATKVRTFTQLLGTLREAVGSGWSQTFETVIGNFDEATELWTSVSGAIGGFVQASSDARNKVLGDWKELGGRTMLIAGIKNAFEALMSVLKPIKDAFRELFPPKTGEQLFRMTAAFTQFTDKLKLSDESMDKLKRTFKGVFAIFDTVWQVVKGLVGVFMDLFSATSGGAGGFLSFTAALGDIFVKINAWLKEGDRLKHFFEILGAVLKTPIELISILIGFIGDIFDKFNFGDAEKATTAISDISDALSPMDVLIQRVKDSFAGLGRVLERVWQFLEPVVASIKEALGNAWDALKDSFSSGNFSTVLDAVNTGLFGGLILIVRNFLKGGFFGNSGIGGVMESISGSFDALTGTLEGMQQKVKADVLIKIAIAVGILTISIVALSMIDSDKLTKALTAIGVAFGELLVAMKIMEKIGASKGFMKMPMIALSLILFAVAVLVLTAAIKNLSELSWEELAKGLGGLAVILLILDKSVKPLADNAGDMIKAAAGILILSIALKVLASVVGDFGEMDWGTIGRGLVGMAGALTVIAQTMYMMPKNMFQQAASLMFLSVALKIIADVVKDFGEMEWGTIGKGLASMAGALIIIAQAMYMMPKNMIVQAAGLVAVGVALKIIGDAVAEMGEMGWEQIAKGLVTLAVSLAVIAVGLYAMTGTLAGSAALLVAAVALRVLTGVLKVLGNMSISQLVTALLALAGVFVVLGLAGLLLTPIVPTLLLLGVAVGLIGAAMLMAGLGVLAFVAAITILVALGAAAGAAIGLLLQTIIDKIPELFRAFAEGIVEFAQVIADSGEQFADAATTLITSIAQAVIDSAPKVGEAFTTLLQTLLQTIRDTVPDFFETFKTVVRSFLDAVVELTPDIVQAGYDVVVAILDGIADNIESVIDAGTRIVVNFLDGIADNSQEVIDAGFDLIIRFIEGLTDSINENAPRLREAGKDLAFAIADGMSGGLLSKVGEVKDKAVNLAKSALDGAKDFLGINSPSKAFMEVGMGVAEGFAKGIDDNTNLVNESVILMGGDAIDSMKTTMEKLADIIATDFALDPTITPTLDLSQIQQGANQLKSIIQSDSLSPTVSYSQADSIAATQNAIQPVDTSEAQPVTAVTFEQNNYSPKALSSVEIYRQTKNQLSMAKEALNA